MFGLGSKTWTATICIICILDFMSLGYCTELSGIDFQTKSRVYYKGHVPISDSSTELSGMVLRY